MHLWIAVDEAGYGPRLGPFVVAATRWRTGRRESPAAVNNRLQRFLADPSANLDRRFALNDSKRIYRSQPARLHDLEYAVAGAWGFLGESFPTWSHLWSEIATHDGGQWRRLPWYREYDSDLPVHVDPSQLRRAASHWSALANRTGIHLIGWKAYALFPQKWNERLTEMNKAELLAESTLRLLAELVSGPDIAQYRTIAVVCDRLGGRKFYAGVIQQYLRADWLQVLRETHRVSSYRVFLADGRTLDLEFQVKADAHFSLVGFSSMVAKYLRELAMIPMNRFWQSRIDGLRPTAGYPKDADRFIEQVTDDCRLLGVHELQWIRQL